MTLRPLVPELLVSDINNSRDFYLNDLSFELLYERPENKFIYMNFEGAELMIQESSSSTRSWIVDLMERPYGRGINFQIAVKDVDALYQRLKTRGHDFYLNMEEKWYRKDDIEVGNRQFLIQDPDGYLLRFAQDLGSRPISN